MFIGMFPNHDFMSVKCRMDVLQFLRFEKEYFTVLSEVLLKIPNTTVPIILFLLATYRSLVKHLWPNTQSH